MKIYLSRILVLLLAAFFVSGANSKDKKNIKNPLKIQSNFLCNWKQDFTFDIDQLIVKFSNISKGNFDEVIWYFGDKEYSQQANPVHIYGEEGTYRICMSINNFSCSCVREKCETIFVAAPCTKNRDFAIR